MSNQSTRQPNVIVFFTDQQRWDSTGVHGNPLDLTPNFDRMAQQGTDVHYSFTCQPVCGPARSYDLEADPHGLNNLVNQAAYSAIKAELRERLIARMVAAGEGAPIIEAAPEQPSGQRRATITEVRNAHVVR